DQVVSGGPSDFHTRSASETSRLLKTQPLGLSRKYLSFLFLSLISFLPTSQKNFRIKSSEAQLLMPQLSSFKDKENQILEADLDSLAPNSGDKILEDLIEEFQSEEHPSPKFDFSSLDSAKILKRLYPRMDLEYFRIKSFLDPSTLDLIESLRGINLAAALNRRVNGDENELEPLPPAPGFNPGFNSGACPEEFPTPDEEEQKVEAIPQDYKERAHQFIASMEKELARLSERIYNKFSDVINDALSEKTSLINAIPEILRDLKVENFSDLLRWMRLYKLQIMLSGKLDESIEEQTKIHLENFANNSLENFLEITSGKTERIEACIEAASYACKALLALYELASIEHKLILLAGLNKLEEDVILKISADDLGRHLDLYTQDLNNTVGSGLAQLTHGRVKDFFQIKDEVPRDSRIYNLRDPGLRTIAQVVKIDQHFVLLTTNKHLGDASPIFYDYEYKGKLRRFKVEIAEPSAIDSRPIFVLRDVENHDCLITINTNILLNDPPTSAGYGHWAFFAGTNSNANLEDRTSRIPEFLEKMLEDYELEKKPENIEEFSELSLSDYDSVVLIRLCPDIYDRFSTACVPDRILERILLEHSLGKNKVVAAPFIVSTHPENDIAETIKIYKKEFAEKKIAFLIYLPAHGNLNKTILGSRGMLDPAEFISKLDGLNVDAFIVATPCHQGGFRDVCTNRMQKAEKGSNLNFFFICSQSGFSFTSGPSSTRSNDVIINFTRSPAYDAFRILEILNGETWGQAHINADLKTKALEHSVSDAQAYSSTKKLGYLKKKDSPEAKDRFDNSSATDKSA
ncbi:MAG: hypothetical protein KDD56_05910, partial [Bdellovibrionales bacterium]|nr:hypothetical protein [Bdellovibrionales bacterium]